MNHQKIFQGKNIENISEKKLTEDYAKNLVDRRCGKEIKPDGIEKEFLITNPLSIIYNDRDSEVLNLNIETWADVDRKTFMCWGDYWVKVKLLQAFRKLGVNINVKPKDADVTIYLWGSPFPVRNSYPYFFNPKSYNVMWFYSHPEKMTKEEMLRYDMVFCLSEYYLEIIKKWHYNICDKPLLSCSDFEIPEKEFEKDIDVLFIGNARGGSEFGRKAIEWLDPDDGVVVKVFGHKWYNYEYVKKWYEDRYWPYEKLNEIYYRSKIVLVDGHQEMNDLGFVQMKIFDIFSSGSLPISLYNIGMENIFGDTVPMFKTKNEMNELIKFYLKNADERDEKISAGYEISHGENYEKRAKEILSNLSNFFEKAKKHI